MWLLESLKIRFSEHRSGINAFTGRRFIIIIIIIKLFHVDEYKNLQ